MMMAKEADRKKMTPENFEMETTQPNKVLLPYRGELWGELLYHALEAVLPLFGDDCERGLFYDDAIRKTSVCILFNIQRQQIRATAYITVQTALAACVVTHLPIIAEVSELVSVLDEFFENGGAGLSPNYLENYRKKYRKWRNNTA